MMTPARLPDPPEHKQLVALTPQDVPAAQAEIADWCTKQIIVLNAERSDLIDSIDVAVQNQWAIGTFEGMLRRTKHRISYYEKIKAAVEAGYFIVPNFETEVMAVRVTGRPPRLTSSYEQNKITEAISTLPPVGEGRYVDQQQKYRDLTYTANDPKNPGQTKKVGHYEVAGYDDDVDFPVIAVKPQVLSATARAMSLKIFDRIGVVTGRHKDPVVVGEIIHPSARAMQYYRQCKRVSFFIAWWLDTRSL